MRYINILEMKNGVPYDLDTFPIFEEQLSDEVIEEVEKEFIGRIMIIKDITDDEEECYLEEGRFEHNGVELYLIHS